jgi:transposase
MIPIENGVRVWLATGYTDMRRGFPGLALQVQEILKVSATNSPPSNDAISQGRISRF